MARLLLGLGVLFVLPAIALHGRAFDDAPPYKNAALSPEERAQDLVGRMTPEEKARMLAGSGWMESTPNERLGIPAIKMADGPMGVRNWAGSSAVTSAASTAPVYATAFPAGIAMASSWDVDLVQAEGRAIAQQLKALGRDMILAPTVNIARTPLWGRNFEGYGEDPYLAARMNPDNLQFSESDSDNMAGFAFGRSSRLGVDIEKIREFPDMLEILEQHFTQREKHEVLSCPEDQRLILFYRFWTRKEAVLKAHGEGLLKALTSVDVAAGEGRGPWRVRVAGKPDAEEYSLTDIEGPAGFAAAVAIAGSPNEILIIWDK